MSEFLNVTCTSNSNKDPLDIALEAFEDPDMGRGDRNKFKSRRAGGKKEDTYDYLSTIQLLGE